MKRFRIATAAFFFLLIVGAPITLRATEPAAENHTTAAEGEHADAAHSEHAPKTLMGLPGWFWKFLNLATFFGLLIYLLGGPIGKSFRDRREGIREQLAEAKQRREKSDRLAQDIDARLQKLEGEIQVILTRAKEDGERQKNEIIAGAETEAAKILATARTEVDTRVKMARQELFDLAGDLATGRATALISGSITEADRQRLFAEGLRDIEEMR